MENPQPLEAKAVTADETHSITPVGRPGRRTIFILLAITGVASGLFLSWEWLVAAGLSSFIVALLPCAAMCTAGLCASRLSHKGSCAIKAEASAAKAANGATASRLSGPVPGRTPAGASAPRGDPS